MLIRRTIAATVLLALSLTVLAPGVAADQVYRTEKIAFTAVGSAPLRDGFVVNIHANGPKLYAHEIYTLKGAAKYTTYQVYLTAFGDPPDCTAALADPLPMAGLSTNAAGNGQASAKIPPEVITEFGLHGATIGVVWTIMVGDDIHYQTGCTTAVLD